MRKKIIALSLTTAMVVCNSMTVWAADNWGGNGTNTTYTLNTDGGNADRTVNNDKDGQKDVKGIYVVGNGVTDENGDGVPDTDENNDGRDITMDEDGDNNITIPEGATFSVNIAWGDMNFKYLAGSTEWKPDKQAYEETSNGHWEPVIASTGNRIIVTNKSNVGILTRVSYTPDTTSGIYDGVVGGIFDASTGGTALTATRSYQGRNQNIDNAFTLPNYVNYSGNDVIEEAYLQLTGSPIKSWTTNSKIGTVTVAIEYNLDAVPKP